MRKKWIWRGQRAECYGLTCVPQNSHVEATNQGTSGCNCIWREGHQLIKSQWGHLGEPSSDMINILIRGNLGAHVHEQKEDHGEDTGGRWPFLGKPRTDRHIRRSQPDTFLSDVQRPELWGNILLFKSHLACGPLLSSPANLYNGEHITWDTSGNVSSNFSNQLSPLTSWGFALLTPREYLSCWPSCASKGKCLTVFMNTRRYSCNRE